MNRTFIAFADELEKIAEAEKDAGLKEMLQTASKKTKDLASSASDKFLEASIKFHMKMHENPKLKKLVEAATDPNSPDSTPITTPLVEAGKRLIHM